MLGGDYEVMVGGVGCWGGITRWWWEGLGVGLGGKVPPIGCGQMARGPTRCGTDRHTCSSLHACKLGAKATPRRNVY